MGMGIGYKIGNGNGREWEHKKPFPVISILQLEFHRCCRQFIDIPLNNVVDIVSAGQQL